MSESVKWGDLNERSRKIVLERVVPIYRWIEQNKHKYPSGFCSTDFGHVIPRKLGHPECFAPKEDALDASRVSAILWNLQQAGYITRIPTGRGVQSEWAVNEDCLPPGTVTYTGVSHVIPEPAPEPTPISQPTQPIENKQAEQAFIEAELKSIKVQRVELGQGQDRWPLTNTHAMIALEDVTLWDVYKIGLALQNTLGSDFSHHPQPEPTLDNEPEVEDNEGETEEQLAEGSPF